MSLITAITIEAIRQAINTAIITVQLRGMVSWDGYYGRQIGSDWKAT